MFCFLVVVLGGSADVKDKIIDPVYIKKAGACSIAVALLINAQVIVRTYKQKGAKFSFKTSKEKISTRTPPC